MASWRARGRRMEPRPTLRNPRPTIACAVDGANEPPQDMEGTNNSSVNPSLRHHSTAYLNTALESMERIRRLNLEVEFSDACPSFPVHHDQCVHCQREALREFLLVAVDNDDDDDPIPPRRLDGGASASEV